MQTFHIGLAIVGGLVLIGFAVKHLTGKKRAEGTRRRGGPDSDR
ncbi:hypothetical protein [Streptomyces soliscabiei]|nr:hypothetical protein [Streptomyces sp. NY05-11A]MDX2679239.1 hypothetical protein [Streptomyces sp. NY05-11A]